MTRRITCVLRYFRNILWALACALLFVSPATARAEEPLPGVERRAGRVLDDEHEEYHTPLAGDELNTTFLGYPFTSRPAIVTMSLL